MKAERAHPSHAAVWPCKPLETAPLSPCGLGDQKAEVLTNNPPKKYVVTKIKKNPFYFLFLFFITAALAVIKSHTPRTLLNLIRPFPNVSK